VPPPHARHTLPISTAASSTSRPPPRAGQSVRHRHRPRDGSRKEAATGPRSLVVVNQLGSAAPLFPLRSTLRPRAERASSLKERLSPCRDCRYVRSGLQAATVVDDFAEKPSPWLARAPARGAVSPCFLGRGSSPGRHRRWRVVLPFRLRRSGKGPSRRPKLEDHVWFEDRWMVASLCDE
jgi:hypothetical protein